MNHAVILRRGDAEDLKMRNLRSFAPLRMTVEFISASPARAPLTGSG